MYQPLLFTNDKVILLMSRYAAVLFSVQIEMRCDFPSYVRAVAVLSSIQLLAAYSTLPVTAANMNIGRQVSDWL